ncbi:MAG: pyroglutamyl-peptidase I [Solobacterium sp.]|nr:pyroglutamyl-peptidase I [Solobacterium sp.]
MKILMTAFEPFGKDKINASEEALKLLPKEIDGVEIDKMILPVLYKEAAVKIYDALCEEGYSAVIAIGQAAGRKAITPEAIGINVMHARIQDNAGRMPQHRKLLEGGKDAYFSTLPNEIIVEKIKEAGIPSEVSYHAGTFVCNDVLYHLMYDISVYFPNVLGGFIHVPNCTEQMIDKDGFALDKEEIKKALLIAAKETIAYLPKNVL